MRASASDHHGVSDVAERTPFDRRQVRTCTRRRYAPVRYSALELGSLPRPSHALDGMLRSKARAQTAVMDLMTSSSPECNTGSGDPQRTPVSRRRRRLAPRSDKIMLCNFLSGWSCTRRWHRYGTQEHKDIKVYFEDTVGPQKRRTQLPMLLRNGAAIAQRSSSSSQARSPCNHLR